MGHGQGIEPELISKKHKYFSNKIKFMHFSTYNYFKSCYICYMLLFKVRWNELSFPELGSHYVVHAGLELTIILLQPPKGWDYKHDPSHSFVHP
jgi:hypothetical protein